MISFNDDSVTVAMLGEFVFSFLTNSRCVFEKKSCQCTSKGGLLSIYKQLDRLLTHLLQHEDSIAQCYLIESTHIHRAPSQGGGGTQRTYRESSSRDTNVAGPSVAPSGVVVSSPEPTLLLSHGLLSWSSKGETKQSPGYVQLTKKQNLFGRLRMRHFPLSSSFQLVVFQVNHDGLPFKVEDFVREGKYRMVSTSCVIFCQFVGHGINPFKSKKSTSLVLLKAWLMRCGVSIPEGLWLTNSSPICVLCMNLGRL